MIRHNPGKDCLNRHKQVPKDATAVYDLAWHSVERNRWRGGIAQRRWSWAGLRLRWHGFGKKARGEMLSDLAITNTSKAYQDYVVFVDSKMPEGAARFSVEGRSVSFVGKCSSAVRGSSTQLDEGKLYGTAPRSSMFTSRRSCS